MWMGTYPTVPSRLLSTGELLSDYLKKNPQLVGKATLEKSGAEIPFLPKVSSLPSCSYHIQDPIALQPAHTIISVAIC